MSTWYLLNGWALNASVLKPLEQALNTMGSCIVVDYCEYSLGSVEQSLEYLKQRIPEQSVVVGWSLGGMLAVQLAARHSLKAIICLGANPCFIATTNWPMAMSESEFFRFYQNALTSPERNLQRFLRLCIAGDRRLGRVSQSWIDDRLSLQQQINGLQMLASIDNTAYLSQIHIPQLHLFAEYDAVVPRQAQQWLKRSFNRISSSVLPAASHAFPFSHAESVSRLIQRFMMSL